MTPEATSNVPEVEEVQRLIMELLWVERRRVAQELSHLGLTVPQFMTLNMLAMTGAASPMGALAEMAEQCSATMTGIVDRLVRLGLVQRTRSSEDRRSVLVGLSPEGERFLHQAMTHRRRRVRRILSRFSAEERQQIVHLLQKYLQAVREEEQVEGDLLREPVVGPPDRGGRP